jgi:hypothetical protein
MSNIINNTWTRIAAGVPVSPSVNEIRLNGLYQPAETGPTQGGLAFQAKGVTDTCQVIVRDHAGNQMGDTMAVTHTKRLLTDGGAASAFWLLGAYSLDVSGLAEGTEGLLAEEIG